MPYTNDNPPERIKSLPSHAQEIWIAAFNNADKQHPGDEEASNRIAWAAVKVKYEQNEKGDWIAKEAKVLDELKNKYATIIQEAGRRNQTENKTVKDYVTACSGALSGARDQVTEEQVSNLIKESNVLLAWLKEQAMTKTEDGQSFPSAAYAYVPDSETPSTWKLRIWEDPDKKITKAQLGRAAAALSPGGFKGQKADIPQEDLTTVKRKIRNAYRALEVEDEDIPRWVREAEVRIPVSDFTPLTEATLSTKGKAHITVIKPGFNVSKERYYPPDVLKRDYKLFEGVKMYADHPTPTEEKEKPERSVRDWVATLKNVEVDKGGQLTGEATIVEPWMQEKLAILRDKGMLNEMGISINAIGTASKAEIEGSKTNVIEKFVRVRSVDFVTEAGAGGGVQVYESIDGTVLDIDLVNLETLKEHRPDLVKLVENETKSIMQQEVKQKMELDEKVKALESQVSTLTKENTDLKAQMQAEAEAKAKAVVEATVKEAIGKTTLPEPAKKRLEARFKDAKTADGIAEAIKEEEAYIASIKEAGKVKDLGDSTPKAISADELKSSWRRLHPDWTDAQIETAIKG